MVKLHVMLPWSHLLYAVKRMPPGHVLVVKCETWRYIYRIFRGSRKKKLLGWRKFHQLSHTALEYPYDTKLAPNNGWRSDDYRCLAQRYRGLAYSAMLGGFRRVWWIPVRVGTMSVLFTMVWWVWCGGFRVWLVVCSWFFDLIWGLVYGLVWSVVWLWFRESLQAGGFYLRFY